LSRIPLSHSFVPFAEGDLDQSIPARFDAQARAHDDRLAVHSEDEAVSFRALNRLAGGVAREILGTCGRGPEPVALLFDRGTTIVAALLGVLKAGKFYLVLDAGNPRERLTQVLADSTAELILTDATHFDLARELAEGRVRVLDIAAARASATDEPLDIRPSPDDLALIIYTSGSTGRPKGVTHTHRNVLADTRNVTNELGIIAGDRFLWNTSVGFAGSARTIYSALLNGAALYPFENTDKGLAGLADWLLLHKITILRTVPTTYRAFMATLPESVVFPDVRLVSMGGEPLFRTDVDQFNRHFLPHSVLVHPYGPTECMAVCWNVIRHGEQIDGQKVPIGYPLPGMTVDIVDETGRQLADEEVGEIAVKSRYLSPGYWRDPDRTSAVFRPDGAGTGARVYLTGDLGKRSSDGCLTHMGRRDFQVKIRGFRIEVSEIEAALRGMAPISDAVVVGQPHESGQSRLVAYYVPATSSAVTVSELRASLARTLPDYMVPSLFVSMDALPRTSSGKIDRVRLPAVEGVRPATTAPFTAPATAVETTLADLWVDTLRIDRVGAHDDFFELGGDSLLALKLLSRIEQALHVPLTLKDLAQAPTIASLSRHVSGRQNTSNHAVLVHVRRPANEAEASRPPLLLGPTLFGHVGEWREIFRDATFDRAVYGIEFHGDTPYRTEHPTLEEIVSDVTEVVAARFPDTPVHLAGHSFGAHVVYELGQQLRARAVPPASIVLVDANAFFEGRPFRLRDLVSMADNFPRWLVNGWRIDGLGGLWTWTRRRVVARAARAAALTDPDVGGENPQSVRTVMRAFDWANLPALYRRRLAQSYTAVTNYRHRPTRNRVVYLRCRVRKLVHRHRPDGGWCHHVPPESLETLMIPGDHGSALHRRWRSAFLAVLQRALDVRS
jgi:amino acid adenylation domain-containing protein